MLKIQFSRAVQVMLVVLMVFSTPAFPSDQITTPTLHVDQYPIVDGSTSTQPLGVLTACRMTHTSFSWGRPGISGERRLYPTIKAYDPGARLSLEFTDSDLQDQAMISWKLEEKIRHSATHPSYMNLISRSADLIIVAREPSNDELDLAREKGVEIHYAPIALDAFVFIVNVQNPVKSLTIEQIRDIYTGKITDWVEVGGSPGAIRHYIRNRNSGSQEKMEKMVMRGLEIAPSPDLEIPTSMIGPFNAIINDTRGIGYTVMYYDTNMVHMPQISVIAINGIYPDRSNIRKGTYPFTSHVFTAWIGKLPFDSPARIVRDWLLSDEGQTVVAESGYCPIR